MNENKARGSILILISSPLILIGGIVLRVKSILDVTREQVSTIHLVLTIILSIIAFLVYVAVAIFGFKHGKNIDASRALINRGIFTLILNGILMAYQSIFFNVTTYANVYYHLVYLLLPIVYIVGGILNKTSRR